MGIFNSTNVIIKFDLNWWLQWSLPLMWSTFILVKHISQFYTHKLATQDWIQRIAQKCHLKLKHLKRNQTIRCLKFEFRKNWIKIHWISTLNWNRQWWIRVHIVKICGIFSIRFVDHIKYQWIRKNFCNLNTDLYLSINVSLLVYLSLSRSIDWCK